MCEHCKNRNSIMSNNHCRESAGVRLYHVDLSSVRSLNYKNVRDVRDLRHINNG